MLTFTAVAVLTLHARFLLGLVGGSGKEGEEGEERGEGATQLSGDPEVLEFLDTETLRGMLRDLALRSQCLVNQGDELWQLWIDWELKNLQAAEPADR